MFPEALILITFTMELNGAKLVAGAVLGMDYRIVLVNGKSYMVSPPTIHRLAGAAYWLSDLSDGATLRDMLTTFSRMENVAKALSWFIVGDDTLAEELSHGTPAEVVEALNEAFSLTETRSFLMLLALARSAKMLIAKPRQ